MTRRYIKCVHALNVSIRLGDIAIIVIGRELMRVALRAGHMRHISYAQLPANLDGSCMIVGIAITQIRPIYRCIAVL